MEFVMLFCSDRFQYVIHFFFFFLIFSRFYLPDLKIRLSWKKVKDQRTTNICCQTLFVDAWDLRIGRKKNIYIQIQVGWKINLHARRKLKSSLTDRYLWQWNKVYVRDARGRVGKAFSLVNIFTMEESRWKRESFRDSLAFLFSSDRVDLRLADRQIFSTGDNSGVSFYSLINVKIIIR